MTHGMAEIDGAESDEAESEAMYDDGTAQNLATDCAIIKARVGQVANMAEIQSQDGNWNYSDYMCGLANGLLLAHATMTKGAYKPFSRPAQWIEEAAALQARIAELETENLALISRIVETDCRDYGRDEYQTQSLANQVLIDRLVAAGRMRHKCNDHKGRPIYEFVHASSEGGP